MTATTASLEELLGDSLQGITYSTTEEQKLHRRFLDNQARLARLIRNRQLSLANTQPSEHLILLF